MPTIVLERTFDAPATDEMIAAMKERAEPCLEINAVTRIKTYVADDRLRFVCIFEAADVESVRRAMESAGMEFDSAWSAFAF